MGISKEERKKRQAQYKKKWRESPQGQLSNARANYKYYKKVYMELLEQYKDQEEILTEEDKFNIRLFGIKKQE